MSISPEVVAAARQATQVVTTLGAAIMNALKAAEPIIATQAKAEAWDEGVATALNHAVLNEDGITLRLEHLDGQPWINPYRAEKIGPAV